MATPADQRLLELLGRWLASLELHTKYSSLDDDSYWKVQPWTEHQRPTRWIVDLARQKTIALRAQVEQRAKAGDTQFSDALELMAFLANLVGAEHIERFIPVAEAGNERSLTASRAPDPPHTSDRPRAGDQPRASDPPRAPDPPRTPDRASDSTIQQPSGITATREMPKFAGAKRAPPPAATAQVARNERKPVAAAKPAPRAAAKPAARKPAAQPERAGPSDDQRDQVIADAARLVQWGRKWFELPELIARMADRPSLPDVRKILKENKAAIEKKAGNS
jgi:hypothetical protein